MPRFFPSSVEVARRGHPAPTVQPMCASTVRSARAVGEYAGNAMTLPTVLSCVSGNADFAVNNVVPQ
jgi:hypothetical protein